MKRTATLLLAFLVVMGLFFMPAISGAGGNQDGNSQGGGNQDGNSQGGYSNTTWNTPEPLTLLLLGSGLAALAVIRKKIK